MGEHVTMRPVSGDQTQHPGGGAGAGGAGVGPGAADLDNQLRRSLPVRRHAIKLAWYDMRRNVTRAVITLLLIGLPVALVMGIAIGIESTAVSPPPEVGSSQAVVQARSSYGDKNPEFAVIRADGTGTAETAAQALEALAERTGQQWTATATATWLVGEGEAARYRGVVLVDGGRGTADAVLLTSGRWPENPDEILVTPTGLSEGLPDSGTVAVSAAGQDRDVTVVGTGYGMAENKPASLVGWLDVSTTEPGQVQYLLAAGEECTSHGTAATLPFALRAGYVQAGRRHNDCSHDEWHRPSILDDAVG